MANKYTGLQYYGMTDVNAAYEAALTAKTSADPAQFKTALSTLREKILKAVSIPTMVENTKLFDTIENFYVDSIRATEDRKTYVKLKDSLNKKVDASNSDRWTRDSTGVLAEYLSDDVKNSEIYEMSEVDGVSVGGNRVEPGSYQPGGSNYGRESGSGGIQSVVVTTPDGETHKVKVDSDAFTKLVEEQGGAIQPESGTNISNKEVNKLIKAYPNDITLPKTSTSTTAGGQDIITDPLTGNQYIRSGPTDTYKPYGPQNPEVPPVISGGAGGTAGGTTTQPATSYGPFTTGLMTPMPGVAQPSAPTVAGAYTIKAGDTLSAIAQANGLTVDQLMAANPSITDANKINVGAHLVLPSGGSGQWTTGQYSPITISTQANGQLGTLDGGVTGPVTVPGAMPGVEGARQTLENQINGVFPISTQANGQIGMSDGSIQGPVTVPGAQPGYEGARDVLNQQIINQGGTPAAGTPAGTTPVDQGVITPPAPTPPAVTPPPPVNPTPTTEDLNAGGNFVSPPDITNNVPEDPTPYFDGISQELQNARDAVEKAYQDQLKSIEEQQKASQKKIDDLTKKQGDIIGGEMKDLTTPFQEEYEKSERERLKIEENYFANQQAVNELQTLLTQAMNEVNAASAVTGLTSIRSPRIQAIKDDYNARVGVLQAVMAARNSQISVAENLIDRAVNAKLADRNAQINYYNTVLDFYGNQVSGEKTILATLTSEEKQYAEAKIALLQNDLTQATTTANYIKGLMMDPTTADMVQRAGVTLNDTPAQIQKKFSDYSYVKEITDQTNKMELEGYHGLTLEQALTKPAKDTIVLRDSRNQVRYFYKEPEASTTGSYGIQTAGGRDVMVNKQTGGITQDLGAHVFAPSGSGIDTIDAMIEAALNGAG